MTSEAFFKRGSDYYSEQRSSIRDFEMVASDLMVISAVTKGSSNYVQSISVMRDEMGQVKLKGRCSCPVGRECKHVVSSALTFMVEHNFLSLKSKPKVSEGEAWLEALEATLTSPSERKSILVYRLSPTTEAGKMQLVFYRARLLKKGGYGKQNRIEYHQLMSSYNSRDFLSETDREILDLFGALESRVNRVAYIEGELGGLLLQKMVATGNAYWHGNRNTALSFGERLKSSIKWQEGGRESKLELELPKYVEVLATQPPFYVDIKKHTVGRLELEGMDEKHLPLILKAPAIKNTEIQDFTLAALTMLPTLPLPSQMECEVVDEAPVARLHLFSALHGEQKAHMIELTFGYGNDLVYGAEVGAISLRKEDETIIKVMRDLAFENGAKQRLEAYGFSELIENTRALFMPLTNGLDLWRTFVSTGIAELESLGFEIEIDSTFMMKFSEVQSVDILVDEKQGWFDLNMHVEVEGQVVNLLEIVSELVSNVAINSEIPETLTFQLQENHFVTIPAEQFQPIVKTVLALYKGERVSRLEVQPYEVHTLPQKAKKVHYKGKATVSVNKLQEALKNFEGIKEVPVSQGLQATLRDYQQEGVNWLGFLESYGFGGILADDMGLGKTIQTLAFLQQHKEQGALQNPVLIVAPTSLLSNWKNEAKKFTPDLRIKIHHGLKRKKEIASMSDCDILITTYALLSRDIILLEQMQFDFFILDEAQNIKNHKSKAHAAAKKVKAKNAIALSGTPMENHLGELWAIFDVVMPNFLDDYKNFKTFYQTPIEKEHDLTRSAMLRERIAPFVLRRTKEKVAKELPAKTIMTRSITFEKDQAKLYEGIRISMEKRVRDVIKEKGLGKSHITILDALLKLRQVCCDPRLVPLEEAKSVQNSAKLEMLLELVEELLEEGRRILIFSQFTTMLSIIEEALLTRDVPLSKLTGSTTNREKVIEKFTSGEAHVFLISLKAGGVGLNLTQADTVIHYDPWWNPAAEDQATDRAYRIGQDKPVFVYKLIIEDSVEEKILALQAQKKDRANALYGDETESTSMDAASLLELFS